MKEDQNKISSMIKQTYDMYYKSSRDVKDRLYLLRDELSKEENPKVVKAIDSVLAKVDSLDEGMLVHSKELTLVTSELELYRGKVLLLQEEASSLKQENAEIRSAFLKKQKDDNFVTRLLSLLQVQEVMNQILRWLFVLFSVFFVMKIIENLSSMIFNNVGYPGPELINIPWAWISYMLKISGSAAIVVVVFVTLARFISSQPSKLTEATTLWKSIKSINDEILKGKVEEKNKSNNN